MVLTRTSDTRDANSLDLLHSHASEGWLCGYGGGRVEREGGGERGGWRERKRERERGVERERQRGWRERGVGERERQRHTEREERDRQRDRQRDTDRERQTQRETERHRERHRERETEKEKVVTFAPINMVAMELLRPDRCHAMDGILCQQSGGASHAKSPL